MSKINSIKKHAKNEQTEANKITSTFKSSDETFDIRTFFPESSERDCLTELRRHPTAYQLYRQMKPDWQKHYVDFMTGKASLPLTYDPFFKKLFHPEIHPNRLSSFISSVIGEPVTIKSVLTGEDHSLPSAAFIIIMDIVVEMRDGTLANIEIQKYPYAFTGERMACYSSDLVLRQYSKLKGEKGADFSYRDLKKVYTIVLYESSTAAMKKASLTHGSCIHHGKNAFDTGLEMNLLQEYFLISLDVFAKKDYPKTKSEQTAWLSLLTARTVDDLEQLISDYPWMEATVVEMSEYLYRPEEMMSMFSEALRILDYNTEKYMYEELQKEIIQQKEELAQQEQTLAQQEEIIAQKEQTLAQQEEIIAQKEQTLAQQKDALAQKDEVLVQQKRELSAKDAEIERLKELLEKK